MTSYSTQSLPGRRFREDQTFTEKIHSILTERECSIFDKGLAVYHKRRDVTGLVESLSMVLNTNHKRQLLVPIRDNYVKPSDLVKFNKLCIKFGIALPSRGTLPKKQQKRLSSHDEFSGPKLIEVKRNQNGEWGFSVRGGIEMGMGIFVSWVDHDSFAEKAGLRIGDYIHRVDDTNFDGFSQTEAVQFLRTKSRVTLLVTSYGKIPGFQSANKFYRWVDRDGKPTPPPPEEGDLKMDVLERQVNMTVESGMELGISIRGGAEHGLGIYVSAIDSASLADLHGIQPGNQILEVNGVIFYNILHDDAAKALRAQRTMVMKVKDIGKVPTARIPMPRPAPPEELPSPSSQLSLPASVKKSKGRTTEVAYESHTEEGKSPVLFKKSVKPAKNEMNESARAVLSKSEMAAFTYYISQYEHEQIVVEVLVSKLLKLFNTKEKMQLLSAVRDVIHQRDMEEFNELTIHKEIKSRKAQRTYSMGESVSSQSDEEQGGSYPVMLRHKHALNVDEDGDLDEIPQRLSPITSGHKTSTPDQHNMIARRMRERRHKMHESVLTVVEDDGWEDVLAPKDEKGFQEKLKEIEEKGFQEKLKEMEEKLKKEHEEEMKRLMEEKQRKEEMEEELRIKIEKDLKESIEVQVRRDELQKLEMEFKEKLELALQEEKQKAREEKQKREQLEQEMRGSFKNELESKIRLETKTAMEKQLDDKIEKSITAERQRTEAEMKRRQDLEKEVKATWQEQLQQQKILNDKLEKSIQDEKKRLEEERKRREQLEKEMIQKTALSFEEKERLRAELEEKLRKENEERIKRQQEERLVWEAREKARLEEEIQNNKALRDQLEEERKRREAVEKEKREIENEKKEIENKKNEIEKEKKEIEEKLEHSKKRTRRDPAVERVKMRTAVESDEIDSAFSKEHLQRLAQEEEELRKIAEEEKRLKMLEEEEERMRQQEEISEQRRIENEEEQERQKELEKRRKEDEKLERERKREERMRARQAEEDHLQQVREEEERKQREEEERLRVVEEQKKREEEERRRKEEEQERKNATNTGFGFNSSMMDDLVSEMAKISPMPSPQGGRVTFEDQRIAQKSAIEQERRKAEKMLADKLQKHKEETQVEEDDGMSFAGFTGLKGKIVKVNVTKVNRKLGIAVDGGANTNQRAIVIRQIVPEGSAAQTGAGMEIGQQILTVNGKSLKGLKHKEAVNAIKQAYDGPLNKTIEFVLLAHEDDE